MGSLSFDSQRLIIPVVSKQLGLESCSIASLCIYSLKGIWRSFSGACKEAETHLEEWDIANLTPDILSSSLRWCVKEKALLVGKCLQSQIVECGFEKSSILNKLLIQVYQCCGALDDAEALFVTIRKRDLGVFNVVLQEYARQGTGEAEGALFDRMHEESVLPNKVSYVSILLACATQKTLSKGKRIHSALSFWNCGSDCDTILCTTLMNMYGKCDFVDESRKIFDQQAIRDVVSWTAMISIYANHGKNLEALQIFNEMQQDEAKPNATTLVSVLKACACSGCMSTGQISHHWIYENGFELHVKGGNALIHLYNKCESVEDAETTFKTIPKRDVATWNAMIALYASHNQAIEAVVYFVKMQENGFIPNKITFITILPICANGEMLMVGEWLHTLILDLDLISNTMVCNALLTMYGKCNCLRRAQDLFSQILSKDTAAWNALISTYIQSNSTEEALKQVRQMEYEGSIPDKITFLHVLGLFASFRMLNFGKQIHVIILKDRLETDLAVGNALINMYSKCGSLEDGQRTLDKMQTRDIWSYNPIVELLTEQEKAKQVFQMFEQVLQEAVLPGKVTFVSMLSACANLEIAHAGRRVHACIKHCGHGSDTVVKNAILSMHGKTGNWSDAEAVFEMTLDRDRVAWNTLLTAYACNGLSHRAVQVFNQMQMEGELPDRVTFLACILAYGHILSLQHSKQLHASVITSGLCKDAVVGNALIGMYGKCGRVKDALDMFDQVISYDDLGMESTWNVMISVYAHQGQAIRALQMFDQMRKCGVPANPVTFVSVISACASLLAITEGIMLHAFLQYNGFGKLMPVGNALMNMYGKWGDTAAAQKIFDNMPVQDVISWTTIIGIYSQHGHIQHALDYYMQMQSKGLQPNDVTLLGILNGYSHAGLVEPCLSFLWQSGSALTISDHFVSIVDLLVRAGQLKEAEELSKVMPFGPNLASYTSLLAGCRELIDVERGEFAAKKVFELDPTSSAGRIMLSNVYAAGGREAKAEATRFV